MKNNIKGFAAYIASIFLSFFIMYYGILYVKTFMAEEETFFNIMRIVVFLALIALQIGLGALVMDTKQSKKKDFNTGILVAAVGFVLYITALITTKGSWWNVIPSGIDEWRFFKFYAMPGQAMAYSVLNTSRYSALYLLLTCLLPTVLFGIGIKAHRRYQMKKTEKAELKKSKKQSKNNFEKVDET